MNRAYIEDMVSVLSSRLSMVRTQFLANKSPDEWETIVHLLSEINILQNMLNNLELNHD